MGEGLGPIGYLYVVPSLASAVLLSVRLLCQLHLSGTKVEIDLRL